MHNTRSIKIPQQKQFVFSLQDQLLMRMKDPLVRQFERFIKQLIRINQTHIKQIDHLQDKSFLFDIVQSFVKKKQSKKRELHMKQFVN